MRQDTAALHTALVNKLRQDRAEHAAAIAEIDAVLDTVGDLAGPAIRKRGPGRPKGSKNKTKQKTDQKSGAKKTGKKAARKGRGLKKGGSRVRGVKQSLQEALTGTPQTPAELQAKVSKALGHDVAIATQLHMLKRESKAKTVGRGQWVKA